MMKEPNTGMSTTRPFDKEGHRGCRGLMPENTIPAMIKALELGVTTLEMDISFTKDKQAILSHEPFFNHEITTRPDGTYIDEKDERSYNIYQMTYDSVKKYDVGLKPHPRFPQQQKIKAVKPLLADVFEAIVDAMKTRRRPYPQFNIETKCMPDGDDIYHPKPAEFVELLMKVIQQYHMEENVIIQSFDVRSLQYLHQHYPTIRTALLIEGTDKSGVNSQLNKLGFTPTIYSPDYSLVNQLLVNKCHEKNMLLIPWTVDDKKNIDNLMQLGVDGIITDYPNLFN
ncbi:MAG: glycerophosphodiester phosphodiesterase [Bacteroidetes bacterium]|nr:glycerophosphodiester phosphodiesterase [Bacteroidota bacterium]MBS1756866.1 glycerophosphodiester phosphodiesterase [Bacteroidota bacterium]